MVPVIIEDGKHGTTAIDIYSWLLKQNIIYVDNVITHETANIFNTQLMSKQKNGVSHVDIYINSPGGSVYGLMSMLDMINMTSIQVRTHCCGMAMSAAAILLLAGERGHRTMTENSEVMFHDLSTYMNGTIKDIDVEYFQVQKQKKRLIKFVSEALIGYTEKRVEDELFNRNCYLDAEKAVEIGVVDKIKEKIIE